MQNLFTLLRLLARVAYIISQIDFSSKHNALSTAWTALQTDLFLPFDIISLLRKQWKIAGKKQSRKQLKQ